MKLTRDILLALGFNGEGKGVTGNPLFRLEWQKNHYLIQMELNDYPDDNPNSGILSIHFPELKDQHCQAWEAKPLKNGKSKRVDFIESEDDENVYGIKYITFPERTTPIAWHVTTLERLNEIYTSLTTNEPLKIP